jgi:hypothetical protein
MKAATARILVPALLLWAAVADATTTHGTQTSLYRATVPGSVMVAQLAARAPSSATNKEMRREFESDQDLEPDESPPGSHRGPASARQTGTNFTTPPGGYDAKHLNRLWGRFVGARTSEKGEKHRSAGGGDAGARPSRWNR